MKAGIRWRFFVFTPKSKNRFDEPAEKISVVHFWRKIVKNREKGYVVS